MKKRMLALFLCLCMVLPLLSITTAFAADPVPTMVDAGTEAALKGYLSHSTSKAYYVTLTSNISISYNTTDHGNALSVTKSSAINLNGYTLSITATGRSCNGILVGDNVEFAVMDASAAGTGKLIVTNNAIGLFKDYGAGIRVASNATFYGDANITVKGGEGGAGIGGGYGSYCGTVNLANMPVTDGVSYSINATGGKNGAGIGGGQNGTYAGTIEINDKANVTAKGGEYAAGIGSGVRCVGGKIEITGHGTKVTATGGTHGAGIGGGEVAVIDSLGPGYITIDYGAEVNATGGVNAAGIGSGQGGKGGTVKIGEYTTVTATGGEYAAGIGGESYDGGGAVVSIGKYSIVNAIGGKDGLAIGGAYGNNGSLKITGGSLVLKHGAGATLTYRTENWIVGDLNKPCKAVEITVTNGASPIKGARIGVTLGAYHYGADTDAAGKATIWIPDPTAQNINIHYEELPPANKKPTGSEPYKLDVVLTKGEITTVDFKITNPVAGATPDTKPALPTYFKSVGVSWKNVTDNVDMKATDKFESGKTYSILASGTPVGGYVFAANPVFTVNGRPAIGSGSMPMVCLFMASFVCGANYMLHEADVKGLDAPVGGKTPDTSVEVWALQMPTTGTIAAAQKKPVLADVNATVTWSPNDATFKEGTVYTATLTLTPKSGIAFSTDAVTIGGSAPTSSSGNASKVLTKTFPAATKGDDYEIAVSYDKTDVTAKKGDTVSLTATHNIPTDKLGILSYQWYSNNTNYIGTATKVTGATSKTYSVPTDAEGVRYYFCEVTNVKDGKTTSSFAEGIAIVKVTVAGEFEIVVNYDKTVVTVKKGDAVSLTATHNIPTEKLGVVSHQWYSNSTNYIGTATKITGATSKTYNVPTAAEGVSYYFCEVTNVKDGKTISSFAEGMPIVKVTVTDGKYIFPFTDVPDYEWYYDNVLIAHKNGLVNGKTETEFMPNDNMTVAEAIKLAACMHQLYYDGEVTLVNGKPEWYSTYMDYALANNIIEFDYSSDANKTITRQEYIYIFYKALPESEYTGINYVADNAIPDVKFMSTAQFPPRIYAFYRAGILEGSGDARNFLPHDNIRRCEVAAILTRMFDHSKRKTFALG